MDILETTAASYQALARLAAFIQVHKPSREAYLTYLKAKPTKGDRVKLGKELSALRMFGEEMEKAVMDMGKPPIEGSGDEKSARERIR